MALLENTVADHISVVATIEDVIKDKNTYTVTWGRKRRKLSREMGNRAHHQVPMHAFDVCFYLLDLYDCAAV